MAKRGRRSIRNKRKSVKKYSSKRRSKTMRYLRGGGVKMLPSDKYISKNLKPPAIIKPPGFISEDDEEGEIIQPFMTEREEYIIRKQQAFDKCMNPCKLITDIDEQDSCMKKCSKEANYSSDDDDDMGGGRRRYYRRKQSKSRSRKH
jgi:hypothetical protein